MIAEMCSVALFSIVKIQQGGPVLSYQKHVLKNLHPEQVGWPRFLLAKMVELIDALMGNVPQ